jgi:hypothetical protein
VRDEQTTSAAVVGRAADADGGRWTVDDGMRKAHIPSVGDMSREG